MRKATTKLLSVATFAAIGLAWTASHAAPIPTNVTIDPAALGLAAVAPFQVSTYGLSDYARIVQNDATQSFVEKGYLRFSTFRDPSGSEYSASDSGLNLGSAGYAVYLTFTASGKIAPSGSGFAGYFTSVDYSLYADPHTNNVYGHPTAGSDPTVTVVGTDILLATGSLGAPPTRLPMNQVNLNDGGVPSADVLLTFSLTTPAGREFFSAPLVIDFQEDSFTNTTGVQTIINGTSRTILINGGGGNGNFFTDVPEPASLALIGAGLLGLGFVRRRKA